MVNNPVLGMKSSAEVKLVRLCLGLEVLGATLCERRRELEEIRLDDRAETAGVLDDVSERLNEEMESPARESRSLSSRMGERTGYA